MLKDDDNVVLFQPPIKSTAQLVNAFEVKAMACNLRVDCPSDGIFNAEIAIVAEAPGEREVNGKAPLIGASGSLLWTVLRQHGSRATTVTLQMFLNGSWRSIVTIRRVW